VGHASSTPLAGGLIAPGNAVQRWRLAAGKAAALGRGNTESGVFHTERIEDSFAQKLLEGLTCAACHEHAYCAVHYPSDEELPR